MTVLVTWFATSSGGGERSTIELCNRLSGASQIARVILLYAHSDADARRLLDDRLNARVERYLPHLPLFVWRIVSFWWVFYICVTSRPSIVQVNIRAALTESLAAKLCGCVVVSALRIMPVRRRQLWAYTFVDHMVCISNAVRDRVQSLGWTKHATVIYNGVEVSLFQPCTRRHPFEAKCFYTFGRLVFCQIFHLRRREGEAVARGIDRGPPLVSGCSDDGSP
jgi:glycosyltransferase involved in cell wall biosynthesis